MNYFSNYFASKSHMAYILVLAICVGIGAIGGGNILPTIWLIVSLLTILLFFQYLFIVTKQWQDLSDNGFKKRLFSHALAIRIIAVSLLYLFFDFVTGQPYEFAAADSLYYHDLGLHVSDLINSGQYNLLEKLWYVGFSDKGFPIFLGIIYNIFFNSVLAVRIIDALLGAWTCVLVYRLAQRSFNEKTARIAGILTMLLPNLIYYTGLHLKETLMVFLLVAFMERADYLLRIKNISLKNIAFVVGLGGSLFLFRTVLGASAFIAMFGAFVFTSPTISGWGKRILILISISVIAFFLLFGNVFNEVNEYWGEKETNLESQMHHFSTREGANTLADYGSAAIFAPIIIFAPFPTLVNIEGQENQMMLSGAYFIRNIYAFFVLMGLFALYKQKAIREHLLIILFIFLYLGVLANSGYALSERFHLPAVPFLLILAGYGITQMNNKNKKYFLPYIILISIIIIGWNWFKLAGRGLV